MNKKKLTILQAIIYYRIIPLAVLGIFLFAVRKYAFELLCLLVGVTERSRFYNPYRYLTFSFLIFVYICVSFTTLRSRRYHWFTGRNFGKDTHKYKRSYFELIDYFQDAELHKLDTTQFREEFWKDANGIIFGYAGEKLVKIGSDCESNICVFGPPGSWKTAGFAIPNAVRFPGSVLAIDIKGDIYNYAHTFRKIVRFCPDEPDALTKSCHFDPLAGFNEMTITDRKLYLESIATVLIPDEGGNDGNYFTSRARKYFQGISHMLLHDNPDTTFPEIVHAILNGNYADWVYKAEETDCTEATELLLPFKGNSEKNVSGAYDNLCTALSPFSNEILDELLTDNGTCASISTLDQGQDLYLQISQEHLDSYAPLFTMIIQSLSTAFTRRPDSSTGAKNRPILMLLDEFPQLTFSYKMINRNLSTLRSKTIITALIMQNLSQLECRFDQAGSRSIIGNCNYQLILGSNDISSSKIFSDTIGTHKVLKICNSETTSDSSSSGRSVQEAREPVFYPEDFGDLASSKEMVIYFKGKWTKCKKINCYD